MQFAVAVLIGILCGLAQPVSGQVRANHVGEIAERNTSYQKQFRRLLLSASSRDLATGWQLARDLGRPVTPVLWGMLKAARSNVDQRLVLLIAAVLAGGPGEDERLFAWLARPKAMLEERTMAAMLMVLGPHRARPVPDLWKRLMGPNTEPEPLLALAVRLACARFPDSKDGAPSVHADDPGILGAAAFAGLRISSVQQERMWRNPGRHCDLFFRGALLGEGWRLTLDGKAVTLLDRAREHLNRRADAQDAVRGAAMLLLARAGALDLGAPRPDWRLLQLAASQSASRTALRAWLQAEPLARDEEPQRLAVAYALVQPVAQVLRESAEWARDARIRNHVAVALAYRLCGGQVVAGANSGGDVSGTDHRPGVLMRIERQLPDVPELRFAIWASGGAFPAQPDLSDPYLRQLALLVADGRASRSVVRAVLEESLWRWGSHPGIGPWRAERRLVRDLLLSGSEEGGGKYLPQIRPSQRYFATGLDRRDGFFPIAVALYEFLSRPVAPLPTEYRLR